MADIQCRQHPLEFGQFDTGISPVAHVLLQEHLVRLGVQAFQSGKCSGLSDFLVVLACHQHFLSPNPFQNPKFDKPLHPLPQAHRQFFAQQHCPNDQEIFRRKGFKRCFSNDIHHLYDGFIHDRRTQCQTHTAFVGSIEVRQGFRFLDALFVNQVHPLSGPFDQPAATEDFRKTPISGRLPVDDVLRRDVPDESARAFEEDAVGILFDENAPRQLVVPMAYSVQDGLADGPLVVGKDIVEEKAFLV